MLRAALGFRDAASEHLLGLGALARLHEGRAPVEVRRRVGRVGVDRGLRLLDGLGERAALEQAEGLAREDFGGRGIDRLFGLFCRAFGLRVVLGRRGHRALCLGGRFDLGRLFDLGGDLFGLRRGGFGLGRLGDGDDGNREALIGRPRSHRQCGCVARSGAATRASLGDRHAGHHTENRRDADDGRDDFAEHATSREDFGRGGRRQRGDGFFDRHAALGATGFFGLAGHGRLGAREERVGRLVVVKRDRPLGGPRASRHGRTLGHERSLDLGDGGLDGRGDRGEQLVRGRDGRQAVRRGSHRGDRGQKLGGDLLGGGGLNDRRLGLARLRREVERRRGRTRGGGGRALGTAALPGHAEPLSSIHAIQEARVLCRYFARFDGNWR